MSAPTPRPGGRPRQSRRPWLLPAAGSAVLLAVGVWLLAPAVGGLLEDEPAQEPAAVAGGAPPSALKTTAPAPAPSTAAPTATPAPTEITAPAPDRSSAAPTVTSPTTASPTTATPAPTTAEPGDTGQLPPDRVWRPVVEGFAADFATPGQDWVQRLAAWTTPELADAYAGTDPTRQPSAQLQDLEVTEEGPTSVGVLATYTDAGVGDLAVDLQVLLTADGWRVSSASPGVR